MTIVREWLPWDQPCLPQAAAWLVEHFADHAPTDACDLRHVLCVLPGSRAGRLLLAELLRVCGERGVRLVPPRVLTPGAMVDELLLNDGDTPPLANAHESLLAWMHALRTVDREQLQSLSPEPPADDDWAAWSALARTLQSLHETLAGDMRDFAAAGEAAANLGMPGEGDRWWSIAAVHAQQRDALATLGLIDRHDARQQALLRAIRAAAEGRGHAHTIVLIGTADLNALQKATLQVQSNTVVALVHAPQSESDGFDELGTVRVDAWLTRHLDIDDASIAVAERSSNQAQEAMRFLAHLGGRFAPSDITLGLGDAALLGDLDVAATWAGFGLHDPTGIPLRRSAPWRLLEAAVDWLDDPRFEHLATLLRHVDVERYVAFTARVPDAATDSEPELQQREVRLGHVEWLTLLDDYFTAHLQGRLTGTWLGDPATRTRLRAVYAAVQSMLGPLNVDVHSRRPLQAWCQPLLDVLANVYAIDTEDSTNDSSRPRPAAALRSIDAVLALRDALQEVAAAAPGLQPSVNASAGLRLLLDHLAETAVRQDRGPDSIEALGWLELHLDRAPALAIVGVNDGAVPEAVTGHAFLPDGLRTALGLVNNARRYARDAYLLQAIVRSRPHVRLIVGRRSPQGDPLSPSRLLLACDDRTLVRRVRSFAEDRSGRPEASPIGLAEPKGDAPLGFVIPTLPPVPPPTSMRVTDFAIFLKCPYRYALERLLGLEAFADDAAELNPMSFGSLAHRALATLGTDAAIAESDDAEVIFAYLNEQLHEHVRRDFGSQPLPALRLQIARLEQRLRSFARFQAGEARAGWRIRHCELAFQRNVALDIPGDAPMPLRGRIDRIDENPTTGAWRVIDYKTSESAKPPFMTHHDRKRLPDALADLKWCDLQLPLYHLLATRSELALPGDRIELGYIALPKQSDGVRWHAAEWTQEQIEHGLEAARNVVRAIRRGEYDADRVQRDIKAEFDDFARICQATVFSADAEGDEDEERDE